MSRSLASFFRQVSLKEPSETSIKFKNKKCQNNLKNLNSSFDKTPGHFGSGSIRKYFRKYGVISEMRLHLFLYTDFSKNLFCS